MQDKRSKMCYSRKCAIANAVSFELSLPRPSTGKIFGTARIKIGSEMHLHLKIYPSRTLLFCTRTIFIRDVPKIRCSVNGPSVNHCEVK